MPFKLKIHLFTYWVYFFFYLQTKIEARTVALVFDRICLVGFVIYFTVSFVETILDFFGNPDVSYDFCEQPNFI